MFQQKNGPNDLETSLKPLLLSSPSPARFSPPLSSMEQRVCDLLMQRRTEQQVAQALGRSPNTVHVHVRNIYRKLGIRTRRELFAKVESTQNHQP